jgi:hypothetical protein
MNHDYITSFWHCCFGDYLLYASYMPCYCSLTIAALLANVARPVNFQSYIPCSSYVHISMDTRSHISLDYKLARVSALVVEVYVAKCATRRTKTGPAWPVSVIKTGFEPHGHVPFHSLLLLPQEKHGQIPSTMVRIAFGINVFQRLVARERSISGAGVTMGLNSPKEAFLWTKIMARYVLCR